MSILTLPEDKKEVFIRKSAFKVLSYRVTKPINLQAILSRASISIYSINFNLLDQIKSSLNKYIDILRDKRIILRKQKDEIRINLVGE